MANEMSLFMVKEDEITLLRYLERFVFEVYPRRVPPDWVAFRAAGKDWDKLPEDDLYLVASDIGAALVDKVKRGKDKGNWRIDEVRSPVIYWQRCTTNKDGELVSGQLWAECEVTPQTGRLNAAPDRFRDRWLELESHIHKTFRKGDPKGFWVGQATSRLLKSGALKLRENHHFGRLISIHR